MPPRRTTEFYLNKFKDFPELDGCNFVRGEQDKNYKQVWTHTCPVCSKDEYVKRGYCSGLFKTTTWQLCKGKKSCRCMEGYRWTEDTLFCRVQLHCEGLGATFKGWNGSYKKYRTKCHVVCNTCGDSFGKSTTINDLLHGKTPTTCSGCRVVQARLDAERLVKAEFKDTNFMCFGSSAYLEVLCEVCSFDKYVRAGVCTGVFKTNSNNLRLGQKPCRCSIGYRWSQDQREFRIKEIMEEEGNQLQFTKFITPYLGVDHTYFSYVCVDHGDGRSNLNNFINNGKRCRGCRDAKMRWRNYSERYDEEDHLYVCTMSLGDETFIKVGRTFNPVRREGDYRCTKYNIEFKLIARGTHYYIYHLEQEMKNLLKPFHYTPEIPFGGSITECVSCSEGIVMDALEQTSSLVPDKQPLNLN